MSAPAITVRAERGNTALATPTGESLSIASPSRTTPTAISGGWRDDARGVALVAHAFIQATSSFVTASGRSIVDRWPQSAIFTSRAPGIAGRHFVRERRRRRLILLPDEHQSRAADRRQQRTRVRAGHDRVLLAHVGLRPDVMAHRQIFGLQCRVLGAARMDIDRKLHVDDFGETAAFGEIDIDAPFRLRLRRVVTRAGVEQRELCNPIRCLPHDLQRDVAAHREPGERKTRRRSGKDALGDRRHRVVARVVCHRHRPEAPKFRHLRAHRGAASNSVPARERSAGFRPSSAPSQPICHEKLGFIATCCTATY